MLHFLKTHEFSVFPRKLVWPWVAFGPERGAFAYPIEERTIAVRTLTALDEERRVQLPLELAMPTTEASASRTGSRQPGLHSFAVHPDGRTVVAFGWHEDKPVASVGRVDGSELADELIDLSPAFGDKGPMASTFARDGESIWLSVEGEAEAAIVRLKFPSLAVVGQVAFPPAPPPALHELHLHPREDAVVLMMSCGQDGTFLRVARMRDGGLEAVANQGEGGLEPCGSGEATEDGTRICLVTSEYAELRRWPDLALEAKTEFGEDLAANYNGVRAFGCFLVSATEQDEDEDRVIVLDDALQREGEAPGPPGMFAGRLGKDRLVTIARDKARRPSGHVYLLSR